MTTSLFIWGIIQSLLMGLILPTVKNVRSNRLLSSIFMVVSLNILSQYLLRFTNLKFDIPQLLIIPDCLDLLLPSLLFLYIRRVINRENYQSSLFYYIVPLSWFLVLSGFVATQSDFQFSSYIGTSMQNISLVAIVLWKSLLLALILPQARTLEYSLKKKHRNLLLWPRTLIVFLGLITYISGLNLIFFIIRNYDRDLVEFINVLRVIVNLNYIIFTCFILFISIYFFINNPTVFAGLPAFKRRREAQNSEKLEYILNAVNKQKLYLDTELSERKLSEVLDIPSYIISETLNKYLEKNFSEFINEKRIAEAKRLLKQPENKDLTIYSIAVDSGFKSESGFYVNFKKFTKMTPNQYKKQMLKEKAD